MKVSTHGLYHPEMKDSNQGSSQYWAVRACFNSSFLPQTQNKRMQLFERSDIQ